MADIFISYARSDRNTVENLAAALEAKGYSVWWDRHIEGGAAFAKTIEAELDASKVVIVAWSEASLESDWVKDEAITARDQGKLVPISLDGVVSPMGFKQYHAIEFVGDNANPLADLSRAIETKLGVESRSAEAGTAAPSTQSIFEKLSRPKLISGVVLALLVVVALVVLGPRFMSKQSSDARKNAESELDAPHVLEKSIAVLPFANRSPDPNDAFFAEGMHDDLLTQLSKISDMLVISRTSVLSYADTNKSIPKIAEELGVAAIMEGGVQRAGNRVRINVQLIDAETDAHLWAEIYDRELTAENIFDIQSEITQSIASALNAVLSSDDTAEITDRPTQSLVAYDAYLRGRAILSKTWQSREVLDAAMAAFDEAIAADPNYAAAHAFKAYVNLGVFWTFDIGNKDALAAARENLDRAEALAPDGIDTLIVSGRYHYWGFLDYDRARDFIDRALAKAPNNAQVWALKGSVDRRAGRFDAANVAFKRALDLDPYSINLLNDQVIWHTLFGRFDEARMAIERLRAMDPESESLAALEAFFWFLQDMPERAWTALKETNSDMQFFWPFRALVAARTNDQELFEQAMRDFPKSMSAGKNFTESYEYALAIGLFELGRKDEARVLFQEINETVAGLENPFSGGWSQNAAIYPVDLPGYLGDLDGVNAAVRAYESGKKPDTYAELWDFSAIAAAYAQTSDHDKAFEYLEKLTPVIGPAFFLDVRADRRFDDIRDDPRYATLEKSFEAWAAENYTTID